MQVVTGNSTTFAAMTFGMPSVETFNYIEQLGAQFDARVSDNALSRINEVKDYYKVITLNDVMESLRAANNGLESLALPNRVMHLVTLSELQNAPDVMLPWIMANPVVRDHYNRNAIEGYGDRFNDVFGDCLGDANPLYQAAVNGIFREDENGDYNCEIFMDVVNDETLSIDMSDQMSVIDTWSDLEVFIHRGDRDPTSPFNGKL